MNPAKRLLCLCVLFSVALPAFAFLKPKDARDGVTACFVGLDEQAPTGAALKPNDPRGVVCARRDASKPFEIRLDIANTTDAPVSGDLRIWLNDDWEVAAKGIAPGAPALGRADLRETPLTIPPHSTNSFFATAIPRPGRVLPALYPVHATFAFPGGDALHPIAIFEAVAVEAARSDKGAQAPSPDAQTPSPDAQALPCAILRLALLPAPPFRSCPAPTQRPFPKPARPARSSTGAGSRRTATCASASSASRHGARAAASTGATSRSRCPKPLRSRFASRPRSVPRSGRARAAATAPTTRSSSSRRTAAPPRFIPPW